MANETGNDNLLLKIAGFLAVVLANVSLPAHIEREARQLVEEIGERLSQESDT